MKYSYISYLIDKIEKCVLIFHIINFNLIFLLIVFFLDRFLTKFPSLSYECMILQLE